MLMGRRVLFAPGSRRLKGDRRSGAALASRRRPRRRRSRLRRVPRCYSGRDQLPVDGPPVCRSAPHDERRQNGRPSSCRRSSSSRFRFSFSRTRVHLGSVTRGVALTAEQAAHPKSGPRRRPLELPGSFVTSGHSGRTTHTNRPPRFPVRFRREQRRNCDSHVELVGRDASGPTKSS